MYGLMVDDKLARKPSTSPPTNLRMPPVRACRSSSNSDLTLESLNILLWRFRYLIDDRIVLTDFQRHLNMRGKNLLVAAVVLGAGEYLHFMLFWGN